MAIHIKESSLRQNHLNRKENPNNATWLDIENIKNDVPLLVQTLGVFKEFTKFDGTTKNGYLVSPEMFSSKPAGGTLIIEPDKSPDYNPYKSLYLYINTKVWDDNESFLPKNIKILSKGQVRIFFDGPILNGFNIEYINGVSNNGEGSMYICPTDKQKVKNCSFKGNIIGGIVLSEELLRKSHIKISEDPTDIIFNIANLIVPTIKFERILNDNNKVNIDTLKKNWKLSNEPGNIFEVLYNNSNKFIINNNSNSHIILKSVWPYDFKELSESNIMEVMGDIEKDIIKLISQKPGLGFIKNLKNTQFVNKRIK